MDARETDKMQIQSKPLLSLNETVEINDAKYSINEWETRGQQYLVLPMKESKLKFFEFNIGT